MKNLFAIAFILLLCSCANKKSNDNDEFKNLKSLINDISVKSIALNVEDTIIIDGYYTSLNGKWIAFNDNFLFIDRITPTIQEYFKNNGEMQKILSKGRGPKEIISPALSFFQLPDSNFFYISCNQDMILFSKNFEQLTNNNYIELSSLNVDFDKLLNNPDPKNKAMYEIDFQDAVYFTDKIIQPITTEHMKFNGYFKNNSTNEFYEKSYTLAAIDYKNNQFSIDTLFGHFSPIFQNTVIPNFKQCNIASNNEYLYVSYMADPKIYMYNKDLQICGYIGEVVKGIATEFPETTTVEEAEDSSQEHYNKCGYYSKIKYVNGYLFRNYVKPNKVNGLQIYKDGNLVYEKDIENEFNIIGYIEPYYYAHVKTDLDEEIFKIIKFKIN